LLKIVQKYSGLGDEIWYNHIQCLNQQIILEQKK
jgi:hypothetical protein